VNFSFDMDAESLLHIYFHDTAHNRLAMASRLRYGPEVAVPRIIDALERLDLRQTFFVPGWCMEQYPRAVQLIIDHGHEIAHHGYMHENPNKLSDAEDRAWFKRAVKAIENTTGRKPAGFRAPSYGFSRISLELMLEAGMIYDASLMGHDIPYLLKHKKGTMIELPSQRALDDWTYFVMSRDYNWNMPIVPPEQAFALYRAEFDAAWRHGGLWVAVWHPFATGRLSRCEAMDGLIDYMKGKGGVWFATMEEIAIHARAVLDAGRWKPFVQELPYATGLVPALAQA
jgi:peptidoglycan/xylan/chitin deacetylase (PgdA/CDA1 family)